MILGFQEEFIPKVIDGSKPHSLREGERWEAGMKIHFYGKVRQKGMYKFRPDAVCTGVQNVFMTRTHIVEVTIGNTYLMGHERYSFFEKDGFESEKAFSKFFFYDDKTKIWKHECVRQLVHWTDLKY